MSAILKVDGKPFKAIASAERQRKFMHLDNYVVVEVEGGYGIDLPASAYGCSAREFREAIDTPEELMNEMDRLRAERDDALECLKVQSENVRVARKERDAALEREQALAAHIEVLEAMRVEARDYYIDAHSDGIHDCVTPFDHPGRVATSLARRDLIKQAEALEEVADWIDPVDIADHAKELRQRAQALK